MLKCRERQAGILSGQVLNELAGRQPRWYTCLSDPPVGQKECLVLFLNVKEKISTS